ncbi:hypothetical protein [Acidocella sp.]|jgi:hypothetical protein|uniref:hypothetical protein n=1 Tax=Acidocella sp. TaxID=50710 RepID=UPI002F42EFCB
MSDEKPITGYARVTTARGLVVDVQLISPFLMWWKEMRADGGIILVQGAVPFHAIDTIQFSQTPFPPIQQSIGGMAPQGSA